MSRPTPPALTVRYDGSHAHLRARQRCCGRPRPPRRRPHRTPADLARPPGAAVRPGPLGRHRQRQPQRHVRQRPPGARGRHSRRPAGQHRQPRRSAADVRGGPPSGIGGHAAADHVGAGRIAAQHEPGRASRHRHRLRRAAYPPPPPSTRSSRCTRPDRSRDTRRVRRPTPAARRRIRRARRSRVRPTAVAAADLRARSGIGHRRWVRRPRRARARATSRRACSRSCGRDAPPRCRRARSRSAAPPTTTSSSPTCWPRATTPRWCRRPAAPRSVDNRSINGTFVNGARVESAMLHDGDVVTIGNVDLRLPRRHAGPPHRDRGRHPHRRPRGARRHVDHRGQQDAAGQHLDRRRGPAR